MTPEAPERILERHDASNLIGLPVILLNAALEVVGDPDGAIEVPAVEELSVAAAVARCLLPARLRGRELRVIRHIAGWTRAELADLLGDDVAAEMIEAWETDTPPMPDDVEFGFRLLVRTVLQDQAPGVPAADHLTTRPEIDVYTEEAPPPMVFDRPAGVWRWLEAAR